MLAELVVERTNLVGLGGHDGFSFVWGYVLMAGLPLTGEELVSCANGTMVELGLG
jgi:hypothetical protein